MIIKFLSAGVIAALVTGIFSLIITIKNNKRLIELENSKQKFTMEQERFKGLRDAYNELYSLLPEEKRLGHVIMNLPSKPQFQQDGLKDAYESAENNMAIIYTHFQRYCYLFSEAAQKKITDAVEEIDAITKRIMGLSLQVDGYNTDESSDVEDSSDSIHTKTIQRIQKMAEFEDMYDDLLKKSLREALELGNKK